MRRHIFYNGWKASIKELQTNRIVFTFVIYFLIFVLLTITLDETSGLVQWLFFIPCSLSFVYVMVKIESAHVKLIKEVEENYYLYFNKD